MSSNRLSREHGRDRPRVGQRHVDHEVVAGHGCDLKQLAVQRIVGKRPLRCLGISHVERAVQALDRPLARQSYADQLAPARESSHQVGLDEPERDVQVCFEETLVNECLGRASGLTQEHLLLDLARPVRMHGMVFQDRFPDDLLQFLGSCLAM